MSKKLQIVGAIKTPQADFNQTDETKGDYIKNKPTFLQSGSQTTTSTEDGGKNIYTFLSSDGSSSTFMVQNGSQGNSGVHIGSDEPTDDSTVWINPDGENATIIEGEDGITPHIGENGNWWIGDTDTGVAAGGSSSGGTDGKDATINGVNTLTIEAGTGISATQSGSTLTISSTNTGTITGVSANGTSIATSGVANIPAATTSKYGVTKLSSSTSSTSTTLAATASAVKAAYDLANTANEGLADKAPAYDYGTSDLTAGTSTLATGTLYFVYE